MQEPYQEGHQIADGFRTDVFVCHPCSFREAKFVEGRMIPICHLWDEADEQHRPYHNRIPLEPQIAIANYEYRLGNGHARVFEVVKFLARRYAEISMGVRPDVLNIRETGPFTFDFLAKRSDKTLLPMFPAEFEDFANETRNEYGFPLYIIDTPFYKEVTLAECLLPAEIIVLCTWMNNRVWGAGNQMFAGSLPEGLTEVELEQQWDAD